MFSDKSLGAYLTLLCGTRTIHQQQPGQVVHEDQAGKPPHGVGVGVPEVDIDCPDRGHDRDGYNGHREEHVARNERHRGGGRRDDGRDKEQEHNQGEEN